MSSFIEIVQNFKFRDYVIERLSAHTKNPTYTFTKELPLLYRYRKLDSYTVDNIVKKQLTSSSIAQFNDMFDSTINGNANVQDMAEQKWQESEIDRISAGISESYTTRSDYIKLWEDHYKEKTSQNFRFLNSLGTYVSCFSTDYNSTLMWSHYANSNTGICVAYDFKMCSQNQLLKKLFFPIAYSNTPVDTSDLLEDDYHGTCEYPIDAAVLCAALNKNIVWSYENEWRLLHILTTDRNSIKRIPINISINPTKIYFGYHFLKPCFFYDFRDKAECDSCKSNIENILRLLKYMNANQIHAYIMVPTISSFSQEAKFIELKELQDFITNKFIALSGQDIRYYSIIQDELINLL